MRKWSRQNRKNIRAMIEERTGVSLCVSQRRSRYRVQYAAFAAVCMLCLVTLSAYAYAKFSSLDEDQVGFGAVYQGEGRFEIVVENASDTDIGAGGQRKSYAMVNGRRSGRRPQ